MGRRCTCSVSRRQTHIIIITRFFQKPRLPRIRPGASHPQGRAPTVPSSPVSAPSNRTFCRKGNCPLRRLVIATSHLMTPEHLNCGQCDPGTEFFLSIYFSILMYCKCSCLVGWPGFGRTQRRQLLLCGHGEGLADGWGLHSAQGEKVGPTRGRKRD